MGESTDPAPVEADLGRRAARGSFVTMGAQGAKILLQLLGIVVLARLLSPSDYGLVAMVLVIVGVADTFRDFGLSSAAIQARHLSSGQRTNLFWSNTGIGLGLGLLVALGAPLVSAVYHEPRLTDLARGMSVVFLLNGAATQYRADLNRRLQFRRLAVADVLGPAVGLTVGVIAARAGLGPWSLVLQQVGGIVTMLAAVVALGGWVPGRWAAGEPMRDFFHFGWNLAGSQLVGYVGNNIDGLTTGLRFGNVALGLYNRSFQLVMTPLGQLRAPTTTVSLPVLARLQDDPERAGRYLRRGQLALGYTLVAGVALVLGAADPVTRVFLGERWSSIGPILRWHALAGMCQTLAYVGYWVYLSRGLTAALMRYTLVTTGLLVAAVVVGSQLGTTGVAAGYALASMCEWPLSFWWLGRLTDIPTRELFLGALRILAISAVVAAAAWGAAAATAGTAPWINLLAACLAGVLVYVAVGAGLPWHRRDLQSVLTVVQRGLRR